MRLVALTDIFGYTESFENLISVLSPKFTEIERVAPYGGEKHCFENERQAYEKFSTEVGMESYTERLLSLLEGTEKTPQLLLGFSVGASAIWSASAALSDFKKTRAVGFYSSQIINMMMVEPKIRMNLYFAVNEPKYQIDEVINRLELKRNINCFKTGYKHGFMNNESENFSRVGFEKYLKILNNLNF